MSSGISAVIVAHAKGNKQQQSYGMGRGALDFVPRVRVEETWFHYFRNLEST